jgi:hypothetical protein
MNIYESYQFILKAWNEGASASDIYHMIVDWVEDAKYRLKTKAAKKEAAELWDRFETNDSINKIVEDFVYGKRYSGIRQEMTIV